MKEYAEHAPRFIEASTIITFKGATMAVHPAKPAHGETSIIIFLEDDRAGLRCPRTRREIICSDVHAAFVRARELNWQFPAE